MFNFPRHFERTAGGWVALWHRWRTRRVAGDLAIPEQALEPAVLHADATGGRVQGPTHGVGCFPAPDRTFYRLDRCRGSPALTKVFKTGCAGTLVSDVWGASHAGVCAPHQTCLPHRRRDRKRTEPSHPPGGDWPTFATLLKRVIRDAIRLSPRRRDLPAERFAARPGRRERRWDEVRAQPWEDRHVRRWVQRRRRHRSELVTVRDHPEVPCATTDAARPIRPAVGARTNRSAHGSDGGAEPQAVLMSRVRTLKQRGHNPVSTTIAALRCSLQTGELPPLPGPITAGG